MQEQQVNPIDPLAADIQKLSKEIFVEKVRRTRLIPPEKRLEMGHRLFQWAVQQSLDGIRRQYPDADEARVRQILHRRMIQKRRRDEADIYIDIEDQHEL
jgi:hypothetical protein